MNKIFLVDDDVDDQLIPTCLPRPDLLIIAGRVYIIAGRVYIIAGQDIYPDLLSRPDLLTPVASFR